jgi:DNA-binding MarR family transcriptional regulator
VETVLWLTADEQHAWRLLLRVSLTLVDRLDAELREAHDISLGDYEILAHLSSQPDEMLRMRDLADRALVSKSRLTHTVDRLVARGLVRRQACADDRRGISAVLTPDGRALLELAAPTHVDGVRRLFISRLPKNGVAQLVRALQLVADAPVGGVSSG